jgi:hypothetical protein
MSSSGYAFSFGIVYYLYSISRSNHTTNIWSVESIILQPQP